LIWKTHGKPYGFPRRKINKWWVFHIDVGRPSGYSTIERFEMEAMAHVFVVP
jgi:hypothetical protein